MIVEAEANKTDNNWPYQNDERTTRSMQIIRQLERELREVANISDAKADNIRQDKRAATALGRLLIETAGADDVSQLPLLRVAILVERKRIVRRYLDVLCSRPAITRVETPVLYYALIALPNGDHLIRENHSGHGYHFHYSDDGRRRADILLTFSRDPRASTKPTTWELHAVKKADFEARVTAWGTQKRWSVHVACLEDLAKRKLSDYVRPGKKAALLIP